MHAWSTCMLHSAFMLSVVKMLLKREVMEIASLITENHGIVFLNSCGNPGRGVSKT